MFKDDKKVMRVKAWKNQQGVQNYRLLKYLINKRASEYSIIAWIPFLIIFMILAGSLIGFAWLVSEKFVIGEGSEIKVSSSDRIMIEKLINVLDEKIVVQGEEMNIGEAIVDLDDYREAKADRKGSLVEWYYDKNAYSRIGMDRISPSDAENEGFDKDKVIELQMKNRETASEVVKELKKVCDGFMLFTPLGPITERGLMAWSANEIENNFDEEFGVVKWGNVVEIKLYDKSREFKIKYRQLKEC